ncbi:MAG TPA: IPT/TIG domain-containing protein [Thermoanaerobaculia bacterium]
MDDSDEPSVTPGDGPGAESVGWVGIGFLTLYLLALTLYIVFQLRASWPHCDSVAYKASTLSASTDATPPAANPDANASGSASQTAAFRLDRVDPASGPPKGGEAVTLAGAGFKTGAKVFFGDAPAQNVTVVSPAKITASTPPHATQEKVDVKVTNPDGASVSLPGGYTYGTPPTQPPTTPKPHTVKVTSINPASGDIAGGDQVQIQGDGFLENPAVKLGESPATGVKWNSTTSITAKTPAHAEGTVDVTVTNTDNNSSGKLTGGYTYVSCVTEQCRSRLILLVLLAGTLGGCFHALRSLWIFVGNRSLKRSWVLMYIVLPLNGAVLAFIVFMVISAGGFFSQPQGSSSCFWFIGIAALVGLFSQQAAEKLKQIAEGFFAKVPPNTDSLSGGLTVTSIVPSQGSIEGGLPVQITGTGFTDKSIVAFGGVSATNVRFLNSFLLSVDTPKGTQTGPVDVIVTNPVSNAKGVNRFTYT